MKLVRDTSIETLAAAFLGLVVFWTLAQALLGPVFPSQVSKPQADAACIGEPIRVSYPYAYGTLDPHACAVQCSDDRRRYILYTNGLATQCQVPPGCNDWGEDTGVTCVPPQDELSSIQTESESASQ